MRDRRSAEKEGQAPMSEPTPFERFKALAKKVVTTPKAEVEKRASASRKRARKRRARGTS
jgi:hypothetical protein